jgi:hypothetical protein
MKYPAGERGRRKKMFRTKAENAALAHKVHETESVEKSSFRKHVPEFYF